MIVPFDKPDRFEVDVVASGAPTAKAPILERHAFDTNAELDAFLEGWRARDQHPCSALRAHPYVIS